jgi:hypothetical protein
MPKMTLKEAQEVLEKYNSQIPTLFQGLLECSRDWQAWTYKTMQEDDFHPAEENDTTIAEAEIFIEKLLEAARVVEVAKFVQIIDDHSKSKTIVCEIGEKHVCTSICLDFIKEKLL